MNKEDMSYKGMELVAIAGEARGDFLQALKLAKQKKFDEAKKFIESGEKNIIQAHIVQTELIQAEAAGDYSDITLLMVHGQDHLMTTILLKELVEHIVELYQK